SLFLLSYCLMTPRSPPPSLFPYTTLFRSYTLWRGIYALRDFGPLPWAERAVNRAIIAGKVREQADIPSGRIFLVDHRLCHAASADRKSTRLNSSHVKISYAVFCWKKKIYA